MTQTATVEQRLRQMILDMEIGPGESISERGLEKTLLASRTPVRSALQRLETEGLVRREGRGWIVSPLDLEELRQLFDYRELLEVAALRLAAPRLDKEAVAQMSARLDDCGPDDSTDQSYQTGLEFHLQFARLAGNAFLLQALSDAMVRLAQARWLESDASHPGWDEHRNVLAALQQGMVDDAAAMLEAHIRGARDRVLALLRDGRRSLRSRGVSSR
jgi:DNA-binding GntR family transcriptional regulator